MRAAFCFLDAKYCSIDSVRIIQLRLWPAARITVRRVFARKLGRPSGGASASVHADVTTSGSLAWGYPV